MKSILRCCYAFQAKSRPCIWDSFCSLGLWEIGFPTTFSPNAPPILVSASCHAVFPMAYKMHPACSTNPRQDKRFVAEWLLRASLNVTLEGSDDPTYQHHSVLDEPVRFFVSFHCVLCGDFCFSHFQLHDFCGPSKLGHGGERFLNFQVIDLEEQRESDTDSFLSAAAICLLSFCLSVGAMPTA